MTLLYKRIFLTMLALGMLLPPALAAPAAADSVVAFNIEAATQHHLNTLTPAQHALEGRTFAG